MPIEDPVDPDTTGHSVPSVEKLATPIPSWMGVNAYGIFVGILVSLLGFRYLFQPTGYILSLTGHIGYMVSGLGLIFSYWRARVDVEVYASGLLLASNVLIFISQTVGLTQFDMFDATLTLSLAITVALRIRALIRGGTFHIPTWERQQ